MRMDTEITDYSTFAELDRYVHGSAAVIGLQMLPILGTTGPRADAEPAAAALGVAFQLTNFLRDVGEDLDRGRVYLPADELAAFGVDRELLTWSRRTRRPDPRITRALAHLMAHTRAIYRRAAPGIAMLEPSRGRACLRLHALRRDPRRDRTRRVPRPAPTRRGATPPPRGRPRPALTGREWKQWL